VSSLLEHAEGRPACSLEDRILNNKIISTCAITPELPALFKE
jgi:hypothetical protein